MVLTKLDKNNIITNHNLISITGKRNIKILHDQRRTGTVGRKLHESLRLAHTYTETVITQP